MLKPRPDFQSVRVVNTEVDAGGVAKVERGNYPWSFGVATLTLRRRCLAPGLLSIAAQGGGPTGVVFWCGRMAKLTLSTSSGCVLSLRLPPRCFGVQGPMMLASWMIWSLLVVSPRPPSITCMARHPAPVTTVPTAVPQRADVLATDLAGIPLCSSLAAK